MEDKDLNCLLTSSTLVLSPDLITDMGVKPGDRIYVEFIVKNDIVTPILGVGEKGKVLHKNNSIIYKGQDNEFLQSYGTKFKCYRTKSEEPTYTMYGNKKENAVYASVDKAIEHRSHLTPEILLNKDFVIPNFKENNFTF